MLPVSKMADVFGWQPINWSKVVSHLRELTEDATAVKFLTELDGDRLDNKENCHHIFRHPIFLSLYFQISVVSGVARGCRPRVLEGWQMRSGGVRRC